MTVCMEIKLVINLGGLQLFLCLNFDLKYNVYKETRSKEKLFKLAYFALN